MNKSLVSKRAVYLLLAGAACACASETEGSGAMPSGGAFSASGGVAGNPSGAGGSVAGLGGSSAGSGTIVIGSTSGMGPMCSTANVPVGCQGVQFPIALRNGTAELTPGCIQVEVLQAPEFTEQNRGEVYPPEVRAEDWDRSELPAGACVFRLHGVTPECYRLGRHNGIRNRLCQDWYETGLTPAAYYDARDPVSPSVEPGCPSPNWGSAAQGYWWYMNAVGPDTADLVICAPECAQLFASRGVACVSLQPVAP